MQRFDTRSNANDAGTMKTALHILLGLVVTLTAFLALPGAVSAATPEQEKHAQGVVAEAKTHMAAGEFEQAAKLYMQAYGEVQRPAIVFNAARAYEQATLWAEAKPLFELYLQLDRGTDPDSVAGHLDAQKHLDAVNAKIAADQAAKAAPVQVKVADPLPLPPPVETPPPVEQPRSPVIQDPPAAQPTQTMPDVGTTAQVDDSWSTMKTAGVVTLTAGGVLILASVIVGIVAHDDRVNLDARLASNVKNVGNLTLYGAVTQVEMANGIATYNARQVTAGVLGGIGAAAVVTGGILWWQDSRRDGRSPPQGAQLIPGIAPTQGGATWTLAGQF